MIQRKIVHIDEDKCDGCGLCVPSCHEGALQIVEGKARLVSDIYCDGLGACLGHCPQDAITIIERSSLPFDEQAVAEHVARSAASQAEGPPRAPSPTAGKASALPLIDAPPRAGSPAGHNVPSLQGCPGSRAMQFSALAASESGASRAEEKCQAPEPSRLRNWPVQLHLVPPHAPYLQGADLLLVADCVPFACAGFHRLFLDGRPVLIGCPKLDDGQFYVHKLAQIIRTAGPRSIGVLHMEVPCCLGLVQIARMAIDASGADVPLEQIKISLRGEVLDAQAAAVPAIL